MAPKLLKQTKQTKQAKEVKKVKNAKRGKAAKKPEVSESSAIEEVEEQPMAKEVKNVKQDSPADRSPTRRLKSIKAKASVSSPTRKSPKKLVTRKSPKKSKKGSLKLRARKSKKNPDAPKAPTGGGYGVFLSEHRKHITEELKEKGIFGVTVLAKEVSARWNALGEVAKQEYKDKAKQKMDAYKEKVAEFEAAGGQVNIPNEEAQKKPKLMRNPDAPKIMGGGGYGVFMKEQKAIVKKDLAKRGEYGFSAIAKETGARWKALGDDDKKTYQEKYAKKAEDFKKAMHEFKEAGGKTMCFPVERKRQLRPRKEGSAPGEKRMREDEAARAAIERMRAARASLVGA